MTALLSLLLCLAGVARERWNPPLELARVCQFEASFSRADCAAIFWVIYKRAERAERQWLDVLRDYSTLYEGATSRAREIRRYPWGDVRHETRAFNDAWQEQRTYAADIFLGVVPDPCPAAVHWGGRSDPRPPGFVQVECSRPTVNLMYRVARRGRR